MKIKDELVLQGMNQAASDEIEYNIMGVFQTSDKNTHGYYIVKWTGNAYTLQEKYKCHAFNPPVIIPEGKLVFSSQFYDSNDKNFPLVSRAKHSNPYHGEVKTSCYASHWIDPGEQHNKKFPLSYKRYADTNDLFIDCTRSSSNIGKIEARENLNHDKYVEEVDY